MEDHVNDLVRKIRQKLYNYTQIATPKSITPLERLGSQSQSGEEKEYGCNHLKINPYQARSKKNINLPTKEGLNHVSLKDLKCNEGIDCSANHLHSVKKLKDHNTYLESSIEQLKSKIQDVEKVLTKISQSKKKEKKLCEGSREGEQKNRKDFDEKEVPIKKSSKQRFKKNSSERTLKSSKNNLLPHAFCQQVLKNMMKQSKVMKKRNRGQELRKDNPFIVLENKFTSKNSFKPNKQRFSQSPSQNKKTSQKNVKEDKIKLKRCKSKDSLCYSQTGSNSLISSPYLKPISPYKK